MWQVLVVEDDLQMRAFLARSVSGCPSLELAGEMSSVVEALAWLNSPGRRLDVLLVDLGLPDGSGLDLIRHTVRVHPECECLVVSMFGDEVNVLASIEAGALGYIHKDAAPEDISQTILEMKAGASPISPMIARRVLAKYQKMQRPRAPDQPSELVAASDAVLLSPKEQSVLELIARGFSYVEIGQLQGVTVHTVRTHIKNLYGKLAVHSRSEAVFEATKLGLLPTWGS